MDRGRRKEQVDRAYEIQVKQGTLVCRFFWLSPVK